MQAEYIELDWEEQYDPLYGSPIILPERTLLWRGYDTRYDAISDRYAYYSAMDTVMSYAEQPHRELGCFVTTRPLRILDVRFMGNILERIIQTNQADPHIHDFMSVIISFGLCSLGHQIALLRQRYKDALAAADPGARDLKNSIRAVAATYLPTLVVEQRGVRIAETENDGITMAFLQELFGGGGGIAPPLFDGFISPRLRTPFHTEKDGTLNPELILFNPKRAGLSQLTIYPSNVVLSHISNLLETRCQLIDLSRIRKGARISARFYMSRGGGVGAGAGAGTKKHHLEAVEDALNCEDIDAVKNYEAAAKAGRRWRARIAMVGATVPHLKVTPVTSPYLDI
jgi:hypothetical protein